jgi:hypothetical protein
MFPQQPTAPMQPAFNPQGLGYPVAGIGQMPMQPPANPPVQQPTAMSPDIQALYDQKMRMPVALGQPQMQRLAANGMPVPFTGVDPAQVQQAMGPVGQSGMQPLGGVMPGQQGQLDTMAAQMQLGMQQYAATQPGMGQSPQPTTISSANNLNSLQAAPQQAPAAQPALAGAVMARGGLMKVREAMRRG